jgi:hypothetical protein
MNGILYFHQGWTDIINCLSLIDYYLENYEKIYLFIREDSKNLIDFYLLNKNNRVNPIYINKYNLDNLDTIQYFSKNIDNINNYDILYHGGCHDHNRKDNYNNSFSKSRLFFVESFYTSYNINYMTRISHFNIERNYDLENYKYDEFVKKYGGKYILQHEINNVNSKIPIINLNGVSDTFFDYIKILENAQEIHLLDSVWGAIIYLLDAKYSLFKNIKIYIYCKRGYYDMYKKPIQLSNWIFI